MALQLLFGLWNSRKCDFVEFDKVNFLVVEGNCEIIFCLLTSPKFDFGEVEKAMI